MSHFARATPVLAGALLAAACTGDFGPFSRNQVDLGLVAAERVSGDRLVARVARIYTARVNDPAPDTSHPDGCGASGGCIYSRASTRELIREQWGPRGREQLRDDHGFVTNNLFFDIPGVARPDEWVLATAHYDAWFGGANDNATGVAVLLEMVDALQGLELDRSVRVLLVDGEEIGLVGSGRYVAEYGTDGVLVVLNADMVAHRGTGAGVLDPGGDGVEYVLQANEPSASFAYQMAHLGRGLQEPVALKPIVSPEDGVSLGGLVLGAALSDHAQFWLSGAPAVAPFPAGGMPRWYHTPADTPDQVDNDRLERMGRLFAASLAAFATVSE